jgi:NAD(P)-dependent dehydrogenase (short-subunit alcohol dehydrogenase family)
MALSSAVELLRSVNRLIGEKRYGWRVVAKEEKGLEAARQRTPFPRLGRPEDVANAVLFLASDECGFISGINLMVDGGWSAS